MNDDEMRIVKEFREKFNYAFRSDFSSELMWKIIDWLPEAVKRDTVRLLTKLLEKKIDFLRGAFVQAEQIKFLIKKYSPKPQYCKRMQVAIEDGSVRLLDRAWKIYRAVKIDHKWDAYVEDLPICPWCPPGKNCIGNKDSKNV